MDLNPWSIIAVICVVAVIAVPWFLIANHSAWRTTVILTSQVKVSQINVGYDWLTNGQQTEVLGFYGKEKLTFWNNVSQYFIPNHAYRVVYHADYKGFWSTSEWTLVSVEEIS